jgi:DNA repair exonuclease SbcCD ATPase subunit
VDGSFLQRSRGRESNLCKLDGRIFKALGTSVPDEFRSILNVDAINWQLQHDYPFWFLLSPGEISKELNSIVNLNTIDGALFCIAGKIRSFKVEESSCKSRLEEAKKRAKDLEWVGEADKELKEIEGLSGRTESSRRKRDRLNNILLELDCLREVYRESIPFLSRFREIEKIKSKIDAINSSKERLQQLLKELTSLEESLCQTKDDYSEAKKDLEKILKKQCPLCGTLQPLQCQTCT